MKTEEMITTLETLRKQMYDYYGSLPVDLNQTLNEIKEYLIRNKK